MRLFFAALLVLMVGCYQPMADVCKRPTPVQAVEVIWADPGERKQASELLARRLGVPVYDEASGSKQVLRVTLAGADISPWAGSLPKVWLRTSGLGLLGGLATMLPAGPVAGAVGGGVGLVAGLVYGPFRYHALQDQRETLGYYPWAIYPKSVELVLRGPDGASGTMVSCRPPMPDARPFQKHLSREQATKNEIRQQSLNAFMDALVDYLDKQKIPTA